MDWDGKPIPVDHERAKHWLEEAARSGLPSALHLLGTMLEEGLGVAPDIERAMRLYEKGADRRAFLPSMQCCVRLARIHSKPATERHSPEEAKRRYRAVLEIAEKCKVGEEGHAEIEEARRYLGLAL
ncbi:MAG: tetratricopeptide repeat protein [Usitatibacter sp.]